MNSTGGCSLCSEGTYQAVAYHTIGACNNCTGENVVKMSICYIQYIENN